RREPAARPGKSIGRLVMLSCSALSFIGSDEANQLFSPGWGCRDGRGFQRRGGPGLYLVRRSGRLTLALRLRLAFHFGLYGFTFAGKRPAFARCRPAGNRNRFGWRLILLDRSRPARRKLEYQKPCAVGPRLGSRRGPGRFAQRDEERDVLSVLLGRDALHWRGKSARVEPALVVRHVNAAPMKQHRQRRMAGLGHTAFFHLELHRPAGLKKYTRPRGAGLKTRPDEMGRA